MITTSLEEDKVDEAGRHKGYGKSPFSFPFRLSRRLLAAASCVQVVRKPLRRCQKVAFVFSMHLCPWLPPKCTILGKAPVKQTVRKASP
jgi:hypothetical protein